MAEQAISVLGIAGSLRRDSYNRALLRAASDLAPKDMTITTFDLIDVPLFNEGRRGRGRPRSRSALQTGASCRRRRADGNAPNTTTACLA